ncbi:MAG TPA: formate/nitrite transporter family protein [Methylomirabilota bacterium]|nr:formate/nitrite transporter family protein [Methylomirabilota bacterium]
MGRDPRAGRVVFSVGLVLVVVGGAELFTGNNLIVMAWASGRIGTSAVLRNWAIVYAGNFVGGLGIALAAGGARLHEAGDGAVGAAALGIAARGAGRRREVGGVQDGPHAWLPCATARIG